jgi:hypothetical protein
MRLFTVSCKGLAMSCPALKNLSLVLLFPLLFSQTLHADCTVLRGETVYASADPFNGCTGTITIIGTLILDTDYDLSTANIQTLNIDEGTIFWDGNYNLNLPVDLSINLQNGGTLSPSSSGGACNANKTLSFGSLVYASCNGNGANFSFAEINARGGVNNSELLPVEFLYFTAESKANDTELNWATASETDNDYFIVQQSADGKTWEAIEEIFGQGTTNQTTSYQYTDKERYNTAVSYYRLIQVDFDGTENYSDIVVVNRQPDNDPVNEINIEVFPNPATDHFTLKITNEDFQPIIQLRDILGRPVAIEISNNGTLNHVNLPAGLSSGTYILVVSKGEIVTTKKIFIK